MQNRGTMRARRNAVLEFPSISIVFVALASSFHCAGMCGPVCRAFGGTSWQERAGYHASRLFGYASLGAVAGALGQSAATSPLQRISTVVVVFVAGFTLIQATGLTGRLTPARFPSQAFGFLVRHLRRSPLPAPLVGGLVTALFPCGFLYAAVGHAGATLDAGAGALSMLVFGTLTIPAVWGGTRLLDWLSRRQGGGKPSARVCSIIKGALLVLASALLLLQTFVAKGETRCVGVPGMGIPAFSP